MAAAAVHTGDLGTVLDATGSTGIRGPAAGLPSAGGGTARSTAAGVPGEALRGPPLRHGPTSRTWPGAIAVAVVVTAAMGSGACVV